MVQNQINQKLMKEIRQKFQNYLKGLIAKKKQMTIILLILMLIGRQMINNMRKQIRWKKAKNMIQNQTNQKPMKDIREKIQNCLKGLIAKKGDDDDPVATDIDLETNVTKNPESSTSALVER